MQDNPKTGSTAEIINALLSTVDPDTNEPYMTPPPQRNTHPTKHMPNETHAQRNTCPTQLYLSLSNTRTTRR